LGLHDCGLCYQEMRFLLTNDDGFGALGLNLLAQVCANHGEVTIIAPDQEQSGVGHRVSTRAALLCSERDARCFALAGTPADCVRVGIKGLGLTPDWVISGLNHGGNMGVDVHMSGTVAGAREGAIFGCPAIAISQVIHKQYPFRQEAVQALTARVVAELTARPLDPGQLYNVNLPFAPESDEPEIVFCLPDPSPHDVRYTREGDEFSYAGVFLNRSQLPGRDVSVVFAGKVAVSVLTIV
jgi:5'-nucleotidase